MHIETIRFLYHGSGVWFDEVDLSVKEKDGKYRIAVNNSYYFDEDFDNEKDAKKQMLKIADSRNSLENELRNF